MEKRKLTKEDLDKVRDIEGFPIGTDEDIIALSDAPYYTACPNPFIKKFIAENGTPYDEETDDYHREPFASDVSEGKNDPIYMAHTYHTKVPYKAIMRYILHYTKPGDIVFDGFCGTGMTGVAAQMCGTDNYMLQQELKADENNWGRRNAILNDLSPVATYITYNYNSLVDITAFVEEGQKILQEVEKECGWMYETAHSSDSSVSFLSAEMKPKGRINYTVWSDVFVCPHCGNEFVFWDVAVDAKNKKVNNEFTCPSCGVRLTKRDCQNAVMTVFDENLKTTHTMSRQVPVLINYLYAGKRYEKKPDEADLELLKKIDALTIPYPYPHNRMCEGGESRRNDKYGITNVDQFYTKRNLYVLSALYEKSKTSRFRIVVESVNPGLVSKLVRYNMGKRGNGVLSGTLYLPSLSAEGDVIKAVEGKFKDFQKVFQMTHTFRGALCETSSSTQLKTIPNNTVDYIFTDPPFGDNLNYSELSFIWESWLNVLTRNKAEAIVNDVQGKGIAEYQSLMTNCFLEFYRVLKPNRWMTVEFHNSKNAVWNAIQESLGRAGFIIADVRTLDKKQGSFKQVNNTSAVKQDLVISAYKPKEKFRKEFESKAGTEETAWAFVRQHLANLPVVVDSDHDGKIDIIAERQAYLLFDRMVAYHIMNGIPVPIDATDFYKGLDEKFLKRDGMYFLPDQVNEYDIARIKMDVEPIQFELFVSNEKSAIAWLYQQLDTPQTYAELQPKFMQEVKSVDRYEDMPELSVMLDENFIQDDKGRWYIPDRTKEGDVAKLREKNLWKEFESYMNSKGKLKLFRSEAIRVGFSRLWKDKNYQAIVDMAERLPEQTIQEDDKLLMYYDISLSRVQ
jgi:DNA modification methylase/predicted RNA-binding Zn-ribbon protein involved in translation (DUF1610 family)